LPIPTIHDFSHYGVAIAISIAACFRLCVYLPYFIWGPWTHKRILEGVGSGPGVAVAGH
jgi:hypothetical protein